MSAPASRPVHPSVISVFDGSAGSEYSTWAFLTTCSDDANDKNHKLPNLVTAQSNSVRVYEVDPTSGGGTLGLKHVFSNLAGSVCFLSSLEPNSLVIGFAGHPRVCICKLERSNSEQQQPILLATSLLDLTPALTQHSLGSTSPLEQDVICCLDTTGSRSSKNEATLTCILGGGVAVANMTLTLVGTTWKVASEEPYLLPLSALHSTMAPEDNEEQHHHHGGSSNRVISHGFYAIVDACYLVGYKQPTLLLLHGGGQTWEARMPLPPLRVTALSVSVTHEQSAVLWSLQVPCDAQTVHAASSGIILVQCVNSILQLSNSGKILSGLGVNGWVQATTTTTATTYIIPQANPWPLPKLAIQLDASHLAIVSDSHAMVALRGGQLYMLQFNTQPLALVPCGKSVGSVGQVSNLLAWPFFAGGETTFSHDKKFLNFETKQSSASSLNIGLLFCGSRLGDSSLMGYAYSSSVPLLEAIKQEEGMASGIKRKRDTKEEDNDDFGIIIGSGNISQAYESILQEEEAALYATTLNVVSDDDDNNDDEEEYHTLFASTSRPRLRHLTVLRHLRALDTITALGPVGAPGCVGPLALSNSASTSLAANAQVLPCGYGSSGGLALVTTPGLDDRTIVAEADCLNIKTLFGLPLHKLVLMPMNHGGTSIMQMDNNMTLTEMDMQPWISSSSSPNMWTPAHVFTKTTILNASELTDEFDTNYLVLLAMDHSQQSENHYAIVILSLQQDETPKVCLVHEIGSGHGTLLSSSPMVLQSDDWSPALYIACTWSSGVGTISTVRPPNANDEDFAASESVIRGGQQNDDDDDAMKTDQQDDEEALYYANEAVVAMDVFKAPKGFFTPKPNKASSPNKKPAVKKEDPEKVASKESYTVDSQYRDEFDEDDLELYGLEEEAIGTQSPKSEKTTPSFSSPVVDSRLEELYIGVCRQSGLLQVYRLPVVGGSHMEPALVWQATGCGHGAPLLSPESSNHRNPRMHKVHTAEFRFFLCGPSTSIIQKNKPVSTTGAASVSMAFRKMCLAVETNAGDVYLYMAEVKHDAKTGSSVMTFLRVQLGVVGRPSLEQGRHRAKLKRKKMLPALDGTEKFQFNSLHPFTGLSGQDGLFAATSRPMWFVCERGSPTYLCHRSRHVAPAGGKERPISGFVSGLFTQPNGDGFLTLHERIGRVGSQRLTVFRGISNVFSRQGLFPGSGLCVEKVPLGVTVRRIQFIDDSSISSRDRPLYCMLISREMDVDQSGLNDDGLTEEDRLRIKQEKEDAKVKRQVEADLGGFDIEQEWVEEIERENIYEVDTSIGGAPPIAKSAYALWIVDASNNWNVVDSFELEEYEHGMTMNVMTLSDLAVNTGKASNIVTDTEPQDTMFITVGTGIVDQDGEDVSSKGRVLLFGIESDKKSGTVVLSLVYQKDITHGPVTSLSCLTCEGLSRLVIGAGADVNIEQWGNGKLTQVGFFRAQMQIVEITLFRTFFLLSDAYDSLYFLVWRESDKSLTLLAKDYEPIAVYAAGIMARGGSVSFVCQDDRQNLQFFQYAPGDAAARGGNKLVCRADYHLGMHTINMQSHSCKSSLIIHSATPSSTLAALKQQDPLVGRGEDDQRLGVFFGTANGGQVAVVPLSEPTYWRLTALQSVITNALESNCGLSPKAWRLYRRSCRRGGGRYNDRKKSVIDGDLLRAYVDLDLADQEDLASAVGSTVEAVLDNLLELACASMVL